MAGTTPLPPPPLPRFATATADGIELRLKVVPGSSRSGIVGPLGDRLKVKVAAPPEGGKANREVVALIRRWTGCREVELTSGTGHPEKTVRVRNVPDSFDWTRTR